MKIKRPESPFQSSAEPLEQDAPTIAKSDFADALSQIESGIKTPVGDEAQQGASKPLEATRAALERIALGANLADPEDANRAVEESAQFMIRSRLGEKYRQSERAEVMVKDLSDRIANDPVLKPKLLAILKRIKPE